MLNICKRPYSDVTGHGEDLNCTGSNVTKAVQALPQGGPADLKLLLQLPEACMSKDVRAAVQKAAAGKAATHVCTFLGVRRKQRCLEGAWTITVTIEQTPTTIGGKFADEIVAARAHDLLVLLFCTGRAARRVNFQAWTYADELPEFKNLPLVDAIAKVRERQSLMFKYNEPWCQRPAAAPCRKARALDLVATDVQARFVAATQAAQQLRLQVATGQHTACMPAPARFSESAAAPASAGVGQTQAQSVQQGDTVRKYYMQGVYKPARMGAGLHLVAAQLENFLAPNLGADLPDGLDPPMEKVHQDAFLRRFHQVMQRMGIPSGQQQAVFVPVDIGVLNETCGNTMRPKGDVSKRNNNPRVLSHRQSMDENANPNNM